jgi:hypothetical protein
MNWFINKFENRYTNMLTWLKIRTKYTICLRDSYEYINKSEFYL